MDKEYFKGLRQKHLDAMGAILEKVEAENRQTLNAQERSAYDEHDGLLREIDRQLNGRPGGGLDTRGAGPAKAGRGDYLTSEQRFSEWLTDKMSHGDLKDRRSVASDFDHGAYWRGMVFDDWKGASAEQRAAMQEGVSADGGYLVPVPVAGQWIDLLRDQIVFAQGQAHTIPWDSGSTLTLPVMVTDPVVQNPNEGADIFPPGSDATVNRYPFVARPYALIESFSWELLEDSAIDIAEAVTQNMAKRLATQVQADFIYGSGANVVNGFTGAAGLLTGVEGGTANGAAPTGANGYNYVDIAIEAVRSAKVEPDLIVTSPRAFQTYGRLKNTLNDALRPSPTVASFLNGQNGKRFATTTGVKDTQTVGTASGTCSDLFVMDSSRIYWAIRHDVSVMPLRERFATQRLYAVMLWQRLDATLTHAEGAYWLKGIVGS